ncbi:hypothetical protein ABG067_009239, partial [Albugo candida]
LIEKSKRNPIAEIERLEASTETILADESVEDSSPDEEEAAAEIPVAEAVAIEDLFGDDEEGEESDSCLESPLDPRLMMEGSDEE